MIYEYDCKKHGMFEIIKHHTEHQKIEKCPKCPRKCEQIFTSVNMQPDTLWHGEYYANLNRSFTSKSKKEQYLKENNLAVAEPGWKEQIAARKKQDEGKREKEIEKDLWEQTIKHY